MNKKRLAKGIDDSADDRFDLSELLHPAQAFDRPADVVNDPDLTLNEKRAILASWASDACAIEAAPSLRRAPGAGRTVGFDEVIDALRSLDQQAKDNGNARYRRVLRRNRFISRTPDGSDPQHSVN
ncbi:MAG TPA: hypothetical protein VKW08_10375 [Xanthobacteraceae bacterium]|jgi:hypothetical protein|nr:hypothetical protein [Xanthobacteraceae bacterium]